LGQQQTKPPGGVKAEAACLCANIVGAKWGKEGGKGLRGWGLEALEVAKCQYRGRRWTAHFSPIHPKTLNLAAEIGMEWI
jgi:hypothetical protein